MSSPRVVIGVPLFNHASKFAEALESLLAQTYEGFALILVDDCSTDATPDIAREYAARDPRIVYHRNPQRLGMVDNCRRAFALARELYPDAEFFAWGSDHDLWHPRWLQALVDTLDAHPEVVLAYPLNRRIGAANELLARRPWAFDTAGVTDRWTRVQLTVRGMSAGNMVYGLYRTAILDRAGVYRRVLVPDRLLMTELSIYGEFRQVPQVLWFRRWYGRIFSLGRQRKNFFPNGRPLYMWAPWWFSHAVSLFWTFAVHARGTPEVRPSTGAMLALRYLAFSGFFHLWQSLRAVRQDILERLVALRPYERRLRLVTREIVRRGIGDWTWAHLKPLVGEKARRKALARVKKRTREIAFASVRRPGAFAIRTFRRIPLVRNRVVPSLLKQEIDQVPAAPTAAELDRHMKRIQATSAPILIGPWISEVGFELLYWIPFLQWATRTYGLDQRRLIVVSRGGAALWYQHVTSEYLDVLDLFPLDEYRRRNEERWTEARHQKQFDVTPLDREILQRAQAKLGLADVEVLHPMLMYRLFRFYWFEKAGAGLLTKHTDYRTFTAPPPSAATRELPHEYVAVRFYFRPSFPDTPENRRFAADVIRALSREVPVVLLNTGISIDDHEDLQVPGGQGVYRVDHLMTAECNLDVQSRIISGARGFVGTYGGLAYLAPFYGVPAIGFYSNQSELIPAHLDVGWRLGRLVGMSAVAVDVRSASLLGSIFDSAGATFPRREPAAVSART